MRNPKRGKISSLKFERSEKENDEHAKYREEREKSDDRVTATHGLSKSRRMVTRETDP